MLGLWPGRLEPPHTSPHGNGISYAVTGCAVGLSSVSVSPSSPGSDLPPFVAFGSGSSLASFALSSPGLVCGFGGFAGLPCEGGWWIAWGGKCDWVSAYAEGPSTAAAASVSAPAAAMEARVRAGRRPEGTRCFGRCMSLSQHSPHGTRPANAGIDRTDRVSGLDRGVTRVVRVTGVAPELSR